MGTTKVIKKTCSDQIERGRGSRSETQKDVLGG
jgi:hypothetical protein